MSRRDQIRMSEDETREFLNGRHTMNVATMNHDGSIHLVAMWYGFVGERPAFWTYGRSQKIRNIERNPQVTCLVETGDVYEELMGVELVGRAELVTEYDGLMEIGRSVFERYIGEWTPEMQPYLDQTGAKRLGVIIEPTRVVTWDHRKLQGAY
ncbi:MAG TPA: pyridoxamine 5'-phosphate oxidase family protein [Acidimicrobiales bacterium]|jgi:PPOX class probable F420-dependent enzyme